MFFRSPDHRISRSALPGPGSFSTMAFDEAIFALLLLVVAIQCNVGLLR
jgi:hypothetical protein